MVYGEDGKTELTNRMKVEMLEKDPEFYREEIEYIVKEWERREKEKASPEVVAKWKKEFLDYMNRNRVGNAPLENDSDTVAPNP